MNEWIELKNVLFPWLMGAAPVIVALSAMGAHLAFRRHRRTAVGVAWVSCWVLLFAGVMALGHPSYSLISSTISAAIAVTVAVVTAMLVIPWRELIARDWSWLRIVWWLGRAVFGVGIAILLMYFLVFVAAAMGRIG